MHRWQGRVALVTGASVGIGAAIAEVLVLNGMKVVGCGRSVDKIQALSGKFAGSKGILYPEKCDLTKESEISAMFERIKQQHGGVDVCINNAGLALDAPLLSGDTEKWANMFQVNVMALSICTREAYKSMQERNVTDGHIIHVSSMAGHLYTRTRGLHFYGATKQCVRSLLHGLRHEIRETKTDIRVSEISPGLVESDFLTTYAGEKASQKVYQKNPALRASDVADVVLHTLSAPPGVEIYDVLIVPTKSSL